MAKDPLSIIQPWGVVRAEPGSVYICRERNRLKIGKTTRPVSQRLREAKTWAPDLELLGSRPFWNISRIERHLHCGFAEGWYAGEWFEFEDKRIESILLDGFLAFSTTNRDMNSVDFIYWMNGDGMAEYVMEMNSRKLSLQKFQREVTFNARPTAAERLVTR